MKVSRREVYRNFRSYLKDLRWQILGLMVCSLLVIPLSLVNPELMRVLLDDVMGGQDLALLKWIFIGMAAVFVANLLLEAVKLACSNRIQNHFTYTVRKEAYQKYLNIPFSTYERYSTSELKMRMIDDVDKLGNFLKEQIVDYVCGLLTAVTVITVCAFIDWKYLLVCLPIFPIVMFVDYLISRGTQKINEKIRVVNEQYFSLEQNAISMWKEVKTQCAEETTMNRFGAFRDKLAKLGMVSIRYWLYREIFNDFKMNYLTKVFVYIVGVFLAIHNAVSIGTIIQFGFYYELLFNAIDMVYRSQVSLRTNAPYYKRLMETLSMEEEPNQSLVALHDIQSLDFCDVGYSYDGQHDVLHSVSFSLQKGGRAVMTGLSGAGKSTTLKLMLGLMNPNRGRVEYNHRDIQCYNKDELYQHIGVVMQDGYLFNMSIRENLTIGNPDCGDNVLFSACAAAEILDFIRELPDGFETIIGEGGIKLSGGQRQRILLARAFVKRPKLLLLDEATSALDEPTEEKIIRYLSDDQDNAVFAISHKPSLMRHFTKRITITDGTTNQSE